MTNDEKKQYLKRFHYARKRSKLIQEQIDELREQQTGIMINLDGMPKGNKHSDLSGYMAKLDKLIGELEAEKEIEVIVYREISMSIKKMGVEHLEEILTRRYLLAQSWEKISAEMNYSRRHTIRMHGLALSKFEI